MSDLFGSLGMGGVENMARVAQLAGEQSSAEARATKEYVRMLEERIERMLLVNQAVWSLVMERTGLSERDLTERVVEIDLRDGQLDGRVTKEIVKCEKCDSAISHKFNRCLFCGAEYLGGTEFSKV